MPLGASRLNFLSKKLAEVAAPGGGIVYRTDAYASNVYLALPFDETNELNDVSPDINASSTQATLTNGANSSVTTAEVYWTSAPNYSKALENVNTGGVTSMEYGLSTSIPSSASGTYVIEGWFLADNATTNGNWAISSADSGGRFLFGINNGSSFSFGNENQIGIGAGWHHLAIVCDSGTKRFYYDGFYKGAWSSSNTGFSTLHVGQFNAGDNADFQGHIQDFRVTIGSNRGYTGTNTGTANFTLPQSMVESFAVAGGAAAFSADGVEIAAGGYLEANGSHTNNMSSTSRAGTFSFWFKDINYGTRTGTLRIFTGHDGSDVYIAGPQLWIDSSGNLTIYGYRGVNNGWVMQLGVTGLIADTNWHHCAIAYDRTGASSNAQVYLDGASQTVSVTRYNNDTDGWNYRDHTRFGSYGSTNTGDEGMAIAQFWYDDTYIDVGANIDKFYDSTNIGAVDMGTDGTASGLSAPAIYHYGNTSTFYTNNGRTSGNNIAYTLSANGTITDTATPPLPAATGGTETEINVGGTDYRVHTFTADDTFVVNETITNLEVLAVGGGGGGGYIGWGGGGGAGAFIEGTFSSLSASSYAITVGDGGPRGLNGSAGENGGNGGSTIFNGLTAPGGGGGAGSRNSSVQGLAGPSAGGGNGDRQGTDGNIGGVSNLSQPSVSGFTGTAYGNNGGKGNLLNNNGGGGGGGGAGAAGDDGTQTSVSPYRAGDGGDGRQSSITGTSTYYAGGGAGSASANGGQGGGGNSGQAGTANTGGGGGGDAANGGSGVLIVRYAI